MTLTAKEQEFGRRYPATTDPVGLFLELFRPEADPLAPFDDADMHALLAREDIRLEIYVQQRFRQTYTLDHVIVEMEQARQKALAEPVGRGGCADHCDQNHSARPGDRHAGL
jgi:hypothetical protein